jgi:hypothetical protein
MEVLMNQPQRTILLGALLLSTISAQPASDPSGHWEGSIQSSIGQLNFEIDLARNRTGEFTGAVNQPLEHLTGLPLANIVVDGKSVRFQVKGTPGERAFKGTISDDGKSISGDYSQGGYTIPFSVTRTGDARFEAAVKNPPISSEFEGVWNGTLAANGKQLRAILTLANQPDGIASGSFVTVDDGLEIPIATITQNASSLTLDLKAVGASYSGTLNPDATEMAGTYTQGSHVLPLTFRRSTATEGKK